MSPEPYNLTLCCNKSRTNDVFSRIPVTLDQQVVKWEEYIGICCQTALKPEKNVAFIVD